MQAHTGIVKSKETVQRKLGSAVGLGHSACTLVIKRLNTPLARALDAREPHSSTLQALSHLNAVASSPVCISQTHTTSPPPVAARKRSSSLNCMLPQPPSMPVNCRWGQERICGSRLQSVRSSSRDRTLNNACRDEYSHTMICDQSDTHEANKLSRVESADAPETFPCAGTALGQWRRSGQTG
jgi:hypothetical protein